MAFQGGQVPDDVPRPRPDAAPGSEPADPWAEEEAVQDERRWASHSGGLGPLPSRTWTRGNSRVVVGGCCLPLPIGCLTTVAAAGVVALSVLRRPRA